MDRNKIEMNRNKIDMNQSRIEMNQNKIEKIKSIVFSTQGDFTQYSDFSLELSEVAFLLDSDQDGITNDVDQCSNTPYGAEINSSGCFILPSNNFKLLMPTDVLIPKFNPPIQSFDFKNLVRTV